MSASTTPARWAPRSETNVVAPVSNNATRSTPFSLTRARIAGVFSRLPASSATSVTGVAPAQYAMSASAQPSSGKWKRITPLARSYSVSVKASRLRPIRPIVPAPGSLPPIANSTPGMSPLNSCSLSTLATRVSMRPVMPSMRMPQIGLAVSLSCAAAASVRKLKKAPLSTVSGTGVPLIPTVATAREPTIFTGISVDSTWQAACATSGKAAARTANIDACGSRSWVARRRAPPRARVPALLSRAFIGLLLPWLRGRGCRNHFSRIGVRRCSVEGGWWRQGRKPCEGKKVSGGAIRSVEVAETV